MFNWNNLNKMKDGTYDINMNKVEFKDGYQVSINTRKMCLWEGYIELGKYGFDDYYIGIYTYKNGVKCCETSIWVKDKTLALLLLGNMWKQESIFDWKNKKVVKI